ncbi:suppressor of fused domain protein [Paenibacillus sp. DMB20]|uniref:suppressor of fused domain protein n=1 Tax=Paenibacillus sp. DMB20 TaxID=1642570 RepID=UPI000628219A|nr:suppressor of fused domain protein [Paenibacillus sp. DMB20]KKO52853.1 branched-chain alpha-keto acid dehydrogenase subunit E2 [Paenibacillus sp. DMB20]KKO53785.1 branched-chain alpha-keto acid dehydrogenase subunit E2 [Paenibacillus sp. DMB20]
MSEEVNTTGWDAIEQEMSKIYGDQEPKHYGTLLPYMLGGEDPLDGISAYKAEKPYPHWHFITFGFSELYDKESEDPDYSGYGFELTFRLTRTEGEEEPPAWALNLLQNMGRYIFNSGNIFRSGDYLDANGPICLASDTQLTALAFVEDPELSAVDTPNGQVQFLQMVGITGEELESMQTWNTLGMLKACLEHMPHYITDLSRDSLVRVPAVSEAVQRGMEQDGSNTGFLYVDQLAWEPGKNRLLGKAPATLRLGAKQAGIIGKLLQGRILKGKDLNLVSSDIRVVLEPGAKADFETGEDGIRMKLDEATAAELSRKLQPKEGLIELSAFKGISIQIVKTHIKDQEGNVVSTIG